jgi:hypothetical protein
MTNENELIEGRPMVILVSIPSLPLKFDVEVNLDVHNIIAQRTLLAQLKRDMQTVIEDAITRNFLATMGTEFIESSMRDAGWTSCRVLSGPDIALDIDLGVGRCEFMDDFGTNF